MGFWKQSGFALEGTHLLRRRLSAIAPYVALVATFVFMAIGLVTIVSQGRPLSIIDEHVHLDTAFKFHDGVIPHRGSEFSQELVDEWACGVGHEAGPTNDPCGSPDLSASSLPSGKFTTGYIHYPTYFALGEAFRAVIDSSGLDLPAVTVYRLFSAATLLSGVLVCAAFGLVLGFRRWRLVAVTYIPVASSMIVLQGTMVNPGSAAIMSGAMVAGTGLLWLRRGKGFVWLAIASALASVTAVTSSLPVGAFLFFIFAALVMRRFGWALTGTLKPTIWQLLTLAAIVLAPIVIWGRVIASTATVSNAALYDFAAFSGWRPIVTSVLGELSRLHQPWIDVANLKSGGTSFVAGTLRLVAAGLPVSICILVFGAIILGVLRRTVIGSRKYRSEGLRIRRTIDPIALLAIGTLSVMVLYPPALLFSNALTFGFNYPIVDRYSIAFAPLLVILALVLVRVRHYGPILAGLGVVTVVGLSASAW